MGMGRASAAVGRGLRPLDPPPSLEDDSFHFDILVKDRVAGHSHRGHAGIVRGPVLVAGVGRLAGPLPPLLKGAPEDPESTRHKQASEQPPNTPRQERRH